METRRQDRDILSHQFCGQQREREKKDKKRDRCSKEREREREPQRVNHR